MSLSITMTLRRPSGGLLIVLASVFLIFSVNLKRGTNIDQLSPQHLKISQLEKSIAVPFGQDSFIHQHTILNIKNKYERRQDNHFYDDAVCKGEQALDKIMNQAPTGRVFTRQDQVDAWEVIESRGGVPAELFPALRDLDIPYDQDSVKGVGTYQNKDFHTSDGQTHPRTSGSYNNLFIPAGSESAIIAMDNHSPSAHAGSGVTVPTLNRWSDVVWQNWTAIAAAASTPPNKLRHIIHRDVFTSSTRLIMEYIEVAEKDKLDLPWPGHEYDMRSEDGKALLGTVHGLGIAWLVIDHSDVLGRKVPVVRIWTVTWRPPPSRRGGRPPAKLYYFLGFELRDPVGA
ncbi:MAG: hypothetical protein L6R38_002223 [Xanthoria sp. 2 TBL-2021]|nr:MAG: hypothetical protein L6R38_002223 [Xanthoria sp. 2 TBL-2021]